MICRTLSSCVCGVVAGGLLAGAAAASPPVPAQEISTPDSGTSGAGAVALPNPDDPAEKAYIASQKRRVDAERGMKLIRAKYFRGIRNTEIRQVGISKLRGFTDPAAFPSLLEVFKDDERDVRVAILDHFADQASEEGDATLAWAAVFGEDPWFREEAARRVRNRVDATGKVSTQIQSVVAEGLKREQNRVVAAAANLAQTLSLYEAIPMMISAQVQGGGSGRAADGGDRALAYILVGTQQAFVADLTPVVGDSAVAFDPTLGVVTEGVVLRVIDAVVITYRTEVHAALVGLSSAGWGGRSTEELGWDNTRWREWYTKEFLPYREAQAAKDAGEP